MSDAVVVETERLVLRRLSPETDADFILELLNEPSFLRYIGDRGVRSAADARRYVRDGPVDSYARHGFGLNAVVLKTDDTAIGIAGVLRRDELDDPDLGFAFLPRYWSCGYAVEASTGVMTHAAEVLRLERVLAITSPDNERSIRLLEKLGFAFEGKFELSADEPEISLYAHGAGTSPSPNEVAELR